MRAFSKDLKERVLAARDSGEPTKVVADRFAVSPAWVRRLVQRRRESGSGDVPSARTAPGRTRVLAGREAEIAAAATADPDRTVRQRKADLGLSCSEEALRRELHRLRFRPKERR
ncbi:hypothetical protein LzC2_09580 [Planctomycetes bacterium LzC2]|uniref:Transposase n=1 Tax=Alienimonas chondri TaxID=2681879 RepID=A0ABX1VAE8_9PLAN|nr:hypothetical protein [Alienimonas chondri]